MNREHCLDKLAHGGPVAPEHCGCARCRRVLERLHPAHPMPSPDATDAPSRSCLAVVCVVLTAAGITAAHKLLTALL